MGRELAVILVGFVVATLVVVAWLRYEPRPVTATPEEAPMTSDVEESAPPLAPATAPEPSGCFRVGDTRPQVRAAMGEPDSIVFRLQWFYGSANLTFDNYGTVIDYSDPDEALSLCSR